MFGGLTIMNIRGIVAVMETEKSPDSEVGKLKIDGAVPKEAITFYTEEDFENPQRKNFENWVKKLLSEKEYAKNFGELNYLTECRS